MVPMTGTLDQPVPTDQHLLSIAQQMWQFDGQSRVDPGGSCRVWTGTCADGSTAFLKWHPEPRSWSQEQQAIRVWLPQISQQLTQRSELIASDEGERLLLLSAVAGEPVESRNWSLEELCHIHHQAGVVLGALHRLEAHDDDPVSLDVALPKRLETWITKSDDILEEKQILRARQSFVDGNLFDGDQRTLCHNDYQPRNWLWDGKRIGIIDWEHSHPNHPGFDLVRLQVGAWQQQPQLRDSFLDGYGQLPDWLEDERMDAIVALFAIGCVVWGTQHHQKDLVELGQHCLL